MPHPRSPAADAGVMQNRVGSGHLTALVSPSPPPLLQASVSSAITRRVTHLIPEAPQSDSIGRQGAALAGGGIHIRPWDQERLQSRIKQSGVT